MTEETVVTFDDTVNIAGEIVTITALNARKTAFVMNLLGKLLITGKLRLKEFKGAAAGDLPLAILAAVDEESLVKLAAVIVNKEESFVKDNFSLSWVLEALLIQMRVGEMDKIIRNFTSLVSQIV